MTIYPPNLRTIKTGCESTMTLIRMTHNMTLTLTRNMTLTLTHNMTVTLTHNMTLTLTLNIRKGNTYLLVT